MKAAPAGGGSGCPLRPPTPRRSNLESLIFTGSASASRLRFAPTKTMPFKGSKSHCLSFLDRALRFNPVISFPLSSAPVKHRLHTWREREAESKIAKLQPRVPEGLHVLCTKDFPERLSLLSSNPPGPMGRGRRGRSPGEHVRQREPHYGQRLGTQEAGTGMPQWGLK